MNPHAQPQEAPPSLHQAVFALAGELRAKSRALAATRNPVALAQALILISLARILLTLEEMILAWQEGRLTLPTFPASTPRHAIDFLTPGFRAGYARTTARHSSARRIAARRIAARRAFARLPN